MNGDLKLRVLLSIYFKGTFIVPKIFLVPKYGYGKLRSEGLIKITKKDNLFYATVTEEGEAYIALSLLKYENPH